MYQGRKSLVELAQEVERQATSKVDVVADTQQLSMIPNGDVRLSVPHVGDRTINSIAHRQIGDRLGIPARYYDRMLADNPTLLAENVNCWFQTEPERRMVRTLDGDVRAFLSDSYQRIDNLDVLHATLPVVQDVAKGQLQIASCQVTDRKMYLKVVTPRIEGEVKVGDAVQAGLVISNSETGHGALSVQPMIFRLVCLNGMVGGRDSFRKMHLGSKAGDEVLGKILSDASRKLEDQAFLSSLKDVTRFFLSEDFLQSKIEQLRETTEREVANPIAAAEVLGASLGLTKEETAGMSEKFLHSHDWSQYGMVQAVTAFAQDESLSYDRASELEVAGSKVLDLKASEWKTIAEAA